MKIATRLLLLATFALPTAGTLKAQYNAVVIATGGLKLRATPGQSGKTLALAPFGAKVQVLNRDKGEYGQVVYDPPARRDTIGTLYPPYHPGNERLHIGYWLKVRYAGKTGYMFSGFLADADQLGQYDKKELNNQFRLRTTEGNAGCSNDPVFDPGWHWYAVYETTLGKFNLKKIQPRYAVENYTDENGNYELYPSDVVITADSPEAPVFMIGTRTPWQERSDLPGFWWTTAPNAQYLPDSDQFNTDFLARYGVTAQYVTINDDDQHPRQITQWHLLGKNGERQEVGMLRVYEENSMWSPDHLVFAGDIDSDGKQDYVFASLGEMGYYVLYLSSLAQKGELVRPAAVLWTWYTC
jgi:hypothetical protein